MSTYSYRLKKLRRRYWLIILLLLSLLACSLVYFFVIKDPEILGSNTELGDNISLSLSGKHSEVYIPIDAVNLLPGQFTNWSVLEIHNTSSNTSLDTTMSFVNTEGSSILYDNLIVNLRTLEESNCSDNLGSELYIGNLNGNSSEIVTVNNLQSGKVQALCIKIGIKSSADNSIFGLTTKFSMVVEGVKHI